MRFGCCITDLDHLARLARLRFDYAELSVIDILIPGQEDRAWENNRDRIKQAALPVETTNSLLDISIVRPDFNPQSIDHYLRKAFTRAAEIGIKVIGFGSGSARNIPTGFPPHQAQAQLNYFMTQALAYAQLKGITLGLEPLNQQETNWVNNLVQAQEIIQARQNPNLGLTADFYHLNMQGEPVESLSKIAQQLVHVHVADSSRRLPGPGGYDYKRLFETLKKIGYDSRVSIEAEWKDVNDLEGSLNFLREVSL